MAGLFCYIWDRYVFLKAKLKNEVFIYNYLYHERVKVVLLYLK